MSVLKVEPTQYMDQLLGVVAKQMGETKTAALKALLYRIELLAKHGKFTDAIGLDWVDAAKALSKAGLSAVSDDPVQVDGEEISFDITLLEMNKGKTGFSGVYSTGSGFRGLVPDPEKGGHRHLPVRATAIRAAIDRFEWFEKYGLPYGALGAYIEAHMASNPGMTVDEALEHAKMMTSDTGTRLKKSFSEAQRLAVVNRRRELAGLPSTWDEADVSNMGYELAKSTPAKPTPPTASQAAPVVEQKSVCFVCEDEIAAYEKWTLYGSDHKVVHQTCLDLKGHPFPKHVVKPTVKREPD